MTNLSGVEQLPQPDARGWLAMRNLPDNLQNAEDSTLAADRQRVREDGFGSWTFTRSATATERELLTHLGYVLPVNLTTQVRWLSPGVRQRRWPALENQEPTP